MEAKKDADEQAAASACEGLQQLPLFQQPKQRLTQSGPPQCSIMGCPYEGSSTLIPCRSSSCSLHLHLHHECFLHCVVLKAKPAVQTEMQAKFESGTKVVEQLFLMLASIVVVKLFVDHSISICQTSNCRYYHCTKAVSALTKYMSSAVVACHLPSTQVSRCVRRHRGV
jgi:hypothetical protein